MPKWSAAVFFIVGLMVGYLLTGAGGGNPEVVARVDGLAISYSELEEELRTRFGDRVLSDLIASRMLKAEAQRLKIELRTQEVERRLQELLLQPTTQAALDEGSITLKEVRSNTEQLVLLDDLLCQGLDPRTLETYFKLNKEKLERARLRHLVVAGREEALALKTEIKSLDDFMRLATEHSSDPLSRDEGGDLGWMARDQVPEIFQQFWLEAPVGQVLGPVRGSFGHHLVMVKGRLTSYQELTDQTQEAYARERRSGYLKELRARTKVELNGPSP